MACSGVCDQVCIKCVSCVQVGLLAPHFSELFFFSPGCQQQQHAIHHLIHITTAELRVSKSLGTLQGDVLSYIFNICQSILE